MSTLFVQTLILCLTFLTAQTSLAQGANLDYEKALQAYHADEYDEAFIHLKNALQEDPGLVSARILLAQIRFNAGDIGAAEKESEEALRLGADINLVLPVYGPSLVLQEKIDELFALEKLSGSFTLDSQFEWALLKGQGYLQKGERDLARKEFERAVTILPENVRSNNTLAALYMNSGMGEDARVLIDKSLAMEPKNPKTWQLRGELAFDELQYDQALEYFRKAYKLDPEDLRVQRALARVYLVLGNRKKVQHYLDLILEESPDDPAATLLSAILLIGGGDAELGDSMLGNLSSKLSKLDYTEERSNESMLFIQASAEYVQGNDATAITMFNAYLARNKEDVAAIRLLLDLYLRNGETKRATDLLTSHESLVSTDTGLSIQLLNLYIQNRSMQSARALLEDLKKKGAGRNPYVVVLEAELLRAQAQPEAALALLEGQNFGVKEPVSYGLLRGVLQLERGKTDAAQASAKSLLAAFPDNIGVNNFAAVTYLTLGNLADAERYIARALKLSPDNIDAKFNRAMVLKKRNKLQESSNVLKSIVAESPGHTKSLLLMARILFLQGKYEEAIAWSDKVYAYGGDSGKATELQLEIYSQINDWQNAKLIAQKMVRENPLNSDYLERLAAIAMNLEDQELVENTLRRLYPLWKEDPEKLRQLAQLQLRAGNKDQARKCLQKALTLDEQSYPVRLDLARLDLAEQQYDSAESAVAALQKEFGARTGSALLLGEIALARGQKENAQAHFMAAFQLDKNNTAAIARLYELSMQGVGSDAFTAAMEINLKESSLPAAAVRLLADSYLAQGKTVPATRYYEKLLELPEFAADPAVLNNLANIYATQDLDKALATALKGLDATTEPSSALLDTVGWILARQDENEEALPYLRKAYAKNSTDPEIRYHTGVTLLALGRTAEAATELRAAIDGDQPFAGREEAQRLLASMPE